MLHSKLGKKCVSFLIVSLLLSLLCLPVYAAEIPAHTSDFYVNDFAGILSEDTKAEIMKVGPALADATKTQLVVVTMDTLGGADLEQFATDMYRAYGIGEADTDRGVLMLIVKEDRDFKVETGYGVEGFLNDGKVGRMMDTYFIPYLKNDLWNEGILNGYNAFVQEVKTEYGAQIDSTEPFEYVDKSSEAITKSGVLMFVAFLIMMIWTKMYYSKTVGGKIFGWGTFLGFIALVYYCYKVTSLGWAITTGFGSLIFGFIGFAIASPDPKGGYSSSSSRTRDSSRSSSSSSGGRSYSGGGGSSGGGGASRKF